MSLENDTHEIKKLVEARPIFKPADKVELDKRKADMVKLPDKFFRFEWLMFVIIKAKNEDEAANLFNRLPIEPLFSYPDQIPEDVLQAVDKWDLMRSSYFPEEVDREGHNIS